MTNLIVKSRLPCKGKEDGPLLVKLVQYSRHFYHFNVLLLLVHCNDVILVELFPIFRIFTTQDVHGFANSRHRKNALY